MRKTTSLVVALLVGAACGGSSGGTSGTGGGASSTGSGTSGSTTTTGTGTGAATTGGPNVTPGSPITGELGFTPNASYAASATLSDGGADPANDLIALVEVTAGVSGTVTDACGAIADAGVDGGYQGYGLGISIYSGSTAPISATTYKIIPPPEVASPPATPYAVLAALSADAGVVALAATGTVTLSEADTALVGSLSAAMISLDGGSAGMLSGNFNAAYCPGLTLKPTE